MKRESRTESDTNPYPVMDDHPKGRLLSRTNGTNEIGAHRLSTSKYLPSQMKYEPRIESKANPYIVMIDHPTGRLLPRTIGTDESTSEYLPSQMKYEPGDCPRKTYDDLKNRIVTGYSLDLPKLLDSSDEFESDIEEEAIAVNSFNRETKPAPGTTHDGSLKHESGSAPPRNPGAVRKRTERHHHPVGRISSQIKRVGTPTTSSASSLEPPVLTDSEYDSE